MSNLQREVNNMNASADKKFGNPDTYVRAVELPFDFSKEVDTWAKYGITEVPLLVKSDQGTVFDDRSFKGIFQDGKYRKLVTRDYIVLPNEEVDVIIANLVEKYGDQYGLYLQGTHGAKNRDVKFWELRTHKDSKFTQAIEGSHKVGDDVSIGVIVRNSLGGNMSFGADLFTFRLVCGNGAVARGRDLANMKIRHYGKGALEEMIESLERRLGDMLTDGFDILANYARMTRLKLRAELAEKLVAHVGQKYTPEYIEVERQQTGPAVVTLTNEGKNTTLWQAFNDYTEPIWHNGGTQFQTKAYLTQELHSLMFSELERETLK